MTKDILVGKTTQVRKIQDISILVMFVSEFLCGGPMSLNEVVKAALGGGLNWNCITVE